MYKLLDDENKVQVVIKHEIIWATQKVIVYLFSMKNLVLLSSGRKHIFEG